jgi:hypothetical protein
VSTLNKTEEEFDELPFWCSIEHEAEWRKKVTPPNMDREIPDEEWYDKNENGKVYYIDDDEGNEDDQEYKCKHERNCKAHREICMTKYGHTEITKRK